MGTRVRIDPRPTRPPAPHPARSEGASPPVRPRASSGGPRQPPPAIVLLAILAIVAIVGLRIEGRIHLFSAGTGTNVIHTGAAGNPGSSPGQPVAPAGPPHELSVISHPAGATLRITGGDGSVIRASTPYHGKVPGGAVSLTLSMKGRNTLTQRLTLDRDRSLDLWLDPSGLLLHELGTITTGSAPKQVAFTPDGSQLWVADLAGNGVEIFDVATLKRLADIKLGQDGAVEVIFNHNGTRAYASQMETASVFEIDATTHRVLRQMYTHSAWSKYMALSPDEKTLYVANWSGNNVTVLDLTTGQAVKQIPTVTTPRGLYVTPDGARLFVAGFGGGDLERITLATGASKILLHTGGAMRHLVGDPEHGLLYADDMATDEVFVVDLATERVHKLANTDHNPNTIDLTPDGRVLFVSNRGANNPVSYYLPGPEWGSVLAIDTATGRTLDAIVGGNQTTGLDVSPGGTLLAFSDFLDNRVSLFAIPSYQTLANGGGGRAQAYVAELRKH